MILPKRYIESMSECTPEEAHAILQLTQKMRDRIAKRCEGEPMLLMNAGSLCTQPRIHWHIVPSVLGARGLFHKAANLPFREERSKEELVLLADRLK